MATQQANPVAANLAARQHLLATGIPMRTNLGNFGSFAPGDVARIRLNNTGIITSIDLVVTATVTQGATAATYFPFAPYNMLSNIEFKDYNTTMHVNTDGYSLHLLEEIKQGRSLDTDTTSFQATSTEIRFNLNIPLAYDPGSDLRGALLAQTIVGEQFLNLTFTSNYLGTDSFRNVFDSSGGATATISDINVIVVQNWIQPQSMNNLPLLDLGTVYEIAGGYYSNTDISTNGNKFINYPNVRNVLSILTAGMDAGSPMVDTSFSKFQVIANGNSILREYDYLYIRKVLADRVINSALPSGLVYFGTRAIPISTSLYGNVQAKFDFGTINGGNYTYTQSQFESFYPNGSPLPGIAQQGG